MRTFAGEVYAKLREQELIVAHGGKVAFGHDRVMRYLMPENIWADTCTIGPSGKRYFKDGKELTA